MTTPAASSVLGPELLTGERLLWSGQPQPGLRFRAADAIALPFSLMWAGFAFFWEWSVIHGDTPLFFRLWGIPFVLVGVYMVVGRFFWDAYRRGHTFYGVTDSRVLLITRGLRAKVKTIGLAAIGEMVLKTAPNGAGTLSFGRSHDGVSAWFAAPGWPGAQPAVPSFEEIENVRTVHEIVHRAQMRR